MLNPYAPLIPLLGTATLGLNILTIIGVIVYFLSFKARKTSLIGKISSYLSKHAVILGFVVATLATLASLFLSEIVLFIPCKLCWYQRIFMYPQVIILGLGLYLNDKYAKLYALIFSVIGFIIALYHVLLQFYPGIFPCSDEIANCALKQFSYYGYITIPVMSLSSFAALIVILMFGMKKSH